MVGALGPEDDQEVAEKITKVVLNVMILVIGARTEKMAPQHSSGGTANLKKKNFRVNFCPIIAEHVFGAKYDRKNICNMVATVWGKHET